MEALSEAVEEYNIKYKEIEDRYAPKEKQLIENAESAKKTAEECNRRIKELSTEIGQVGLFGTKLRNQYQKDIDAKLNKCVNLRKQIHDSVDELKSKRNAEIDVIAEKLTAVENELTERIEKEVSDLSIRFCKCATDVMASMIKDKHYKAFHIREMLEIFGIMTKNDIKENLVFSDDKDLKFKVRADLDEILDDQELCEWAGNGQKQVLDDFYYIALSDSAKDKIRQDRQRQFQSRMSVLEQRLTELQSKAEMPSYQAVASGKSDKPASVIKRGSLGAVIAGPAGAIIGVGSALNQNLTNK